MASTNHFLAFQPQKQDFKTILLFGLIAKINTGLNQLIKKEEQIIAKKKNKFRKSMNNNIRTTFGFIEPSNKEICEARDSFYYYSILSNGIRKYWREKQAAFEKQRKKQQIKESLVKFQKFYPDQDEINEQKSMKNFKQSSKKLASNKSLSLRLGLEKQESKMSLRNSIKYSSSNPLHKGNKYIARRKQEVYVFARLNKTLQNFSQRNQVSAGLQTLSLFAKSLTQGKQCLNFSVYEILSQKQQCQNRIESYLDNLTDIIKEIAFSTSSMIPTGEGYMDILRTKIEAVTKQNFRNNPATKHYIELSLNYQLQMKIKGFMKLCTCTNQILRQFLLSPFARNLFTGKSKIIEKIMRKVMEGRYVFSYLQKQIQNFNLPQPRTCTRQKKEEKWVTAFRRKFMPKTVTLR